MLLAIETATPALSVALLDDGAVVAEHHEVVGRGHAECLLPLIRDLLAGRRPHAIAVDCGPGSFTGVRVGLAAAQGLRIAWGLPTHGFSSTALIAAAAQGDGARDHEVAVATIAGHGEIFVQTYAPAPLRPLGPLRSLLPAAAAAAVAHRRVHGGGAATLVAARGWGEAIDALPRARDVALLPSDLARLPLRPIYGRAPDARVPDLTVPA